MIKDLKFFQIAFSIFLQFTLASAQPQMEWVKNQGGKSGFPVPSDVVSDATGNSFITGVFSGTVDFDPGPGLFELATTGVEDNDLFIVKYNNQGTFEWAFKLEGTINSSEVRLVVDPSGDLICTSNFKDIIDFDPGPGVLNLGTNNENNQFIARYNQSGNLVWAFNIANTTVNFSGISSRTITIDNSGNIIIAGHFGATYDFDPGPGTFILTPGTIPERIYIAKYDNAGNFLWALKGIEKEYNGKLDLKVTLQNEIILAGAFNGNRDFDPGAAVYSMISTGITSSFVLNLDSSGLFIWAKQMGGNNSTYCQSIDTDNAGNIFMTGYFADTSDFDPGAGTFNLISAGDVDVFVAKLDLSGNFLWAKQVGSIYPDYAKNIHTDNSGNVIISGTFADTCDFDPNAGIQLLAGVNYRDCFLWKLNSAGDFVWAVQFGGHMTESLSSSFVGPNGETFCTGNFLGDVDFDPGAGTNNINGSGSTLYLSKILDNGSFDWAKSIASWSAVYPKCTAVDLFGHVYAAGLFRGKVDFDNGPGVIELTSISPDTLRDIYISKTDASGNLIFAKQIEGLLEKRVNEMTTDSLGNIYLTGSYIGTVDFDPGPGITSLTTLYDETYILKLDSSGNFLWVKNLVNSTSAVSISNSIHLDAVGDIYIAGYFGNTIDFDPGPGTFNMTSTPAGCTFILKLSSTGTFIWAKSFTNSSGRSYGYSVSTDALGAVYTTGWYLGTIDLDPGPAVQNFVAGTSETMYISKLDASGNFIWAKSIGPARGYDLVTDHLNNIYVSGTFQGTTDFDPGTGILNLTSVNYQYEHFVSKYNSSGNLLWAKLLPGVFVPFMKNIAVDNFGCLYSCHSLPAGNLDLDPGQAIFSYNSTLDVVVLKFEPSGNLAWAVPFDDIYLSGQYPIEEVNCIAVNYNRDVYTAGYFTGPVDFNPDATSYIVNPAGVPDGFLHKISQCGVITISAAASTGICQGDSVLLNAVTPSGISYQWKRNGVPVIGAISNSYYASSAGLYSCMTTGANGCSTSSNGIKVRIICFPPIDPSEKISEYLEPEVALYPNPAMNELTVEINSELSEFEIRVYDIHSKNVLTKIFTGSGKLIHKLNTTNFSPGLYFVDIFRNDSRINSSKIIMKQ